MDAVTALEGVVRAGRDSNPRKQAPEACAISWLGDPPEFSPISWVHLAKSIKYCLTHYCA